MTLLAAGTAGRRRTAAAGAGRLGDGGKFIAHFGGTSTHQLVDALLTALRTLNHLVAPKDQAFKLLAAILTKKLKNWHCYSLMGNHVVITSTT
jgi:hypothetical protein